MPYFLTQVFLSFKESFLTFKESSVREMPLSKFKAQFSATNRAAADIHLFITHIVKALL